MTPEDRQSIHSMALHTERELAKHYAPGFGLFPSASLGGNYYNQVWSRDVAHAAGNYYIYANPAAVIDSLETIFKYQRPDGGLPFRVEREYTSLKIIPGLDIISIPLFWLFEKIFKHRTERPLYEDLEKLDAGDTIPVILITAGDFWNAGEPGRTFVKNHYPQLKKAYHFFKAKTDPEDSLAIIKGPYPDWADSIKKSGKLSTINIWWTHGLHLMEQISRELGFPEDANMFADDYKKTKESVLAKLYNRQEGYFLTIVGGTRISTVASIFGSLYILDAAEAVRVERTLELRVRHSSGLKNFDPPYPANRIFWLLRLVGHAGYHNDFVWPWVTCQNIYVKIKIALEHPDMEIREEYKLSAIAELIAVTRLFKEVGGAYEIVMADKPKGARGLFYDPPKNFLGSLAGYQGIYRKLTKLGWI